MSRKHAAFGAAAGALLISGVIGLAIAAIFMRTENQGERALLQTPAHVYALALARSTAQFDQDPTQTQALLKQLTAADPQILSAAVITEPRSIKYRFLRNRRYLAHSDLARVGQPLDHSHGEDKQLYDLAQRIRSEPTILKFISKPGRPLRIQAAVPIRIKGKHQAMALIETLSPATHDHLSAWPIALAVVLCVLFGGLAGALLPRYRYMLILVFTALASGVWGNLLHEQMLSLEMWISDSWQRHTKIAGLSWDALETGVVPVLEGITYPLWISMVLALVMGILGQLGIGGRIVRALSLHRWAYAYVAPAALGMMLLVFIPFGYGLALGFFNHDHGTYTFVGLNNFVEILASEYPLTHPLNFYFTLGVTILWTVVNVTLHVGIGLMLALVLKDQALHCKGIYRILLILPWAIPNYITALIWKGMFHYQYGAVNHTLSLLGVERVSWFSSFSTAFTANVVTNTWLGFPFMMVISLGALQSIPRDVYEAAAVDGASRWQSFCRITVPLLRPALFPAIVLGSIWTFNMFNIIYLVSEGGPAGASDILITEAYRWAFERADRYGLAAAYALIIFIILLAYTLLTNRLTKASEDLH